VFLRPLFPSLDCGAANTAATKMMKTHGNSNGIYVMPGAGGGSDAKSMTECSEDWVKMDGEHTYLE